MKFGEKFEDLRGKKEGAYMAHVYYGDPNEKFSQKLIKTLVESGADFMELGIPFSDPTSDGPTFQTACERALRNDITPRKCIQGIKKLRDEGLDVPIAVTTYYNIPYVAGVENFLSDLRGIAQAIIVPDVPIEESDVLLETARMNDIDVVFQVTPTTDEGRMRKIAETTSGFLYLVSIEGVTGAREKVADSSFRLVNEARKLTNIPIMVGFGISKGEHAKSVISAGADGIITGSAICKIYEQNLEKPENTLPEVAEFARSIKEGCVLINDDI